MTEREQEIIKHLLDVLRVASPTLIGEGVLQGNVKVRLSNDGKPDPTRDEFEASLRMADAMKLVTSVRNDLTGKNRWTITDQGRVALKQL